MDPLAPRIAARFRQAKIIKIDGPWVDKMRKDFLTLMKNIPRVKSYQDGAILRDGIKTWTQNFKNLFFDEYLNKALKYDESLSDGDRKYIKDKLSKTGWDLYIEMRLPLDYPDDYYSEAARFQQYQQEVKRWATRVKRKAQVFWKEVRDIVEWYEKVRRRYNQNAPNQIQVEVPDVDQVVLEGFRTVIKGYDPETDVDALSRIKEALKAYRKQAAQVAPILLKRQLPMVIDFQLGIDKGGEYMRDHILINGHAGSGGGRSVREIVRILAHEMGHHVFKSIGSKAENFWRTVVSGDYGDIDLREVLSKWPENMWSYEFVEYMANKDPILALQVDTVSQGYEPGSLGKDLARREDFQALLDRGTTKLRVPKNPVTGYAGKNPEEAFCETLGMLVAYGSRAVLPQVQQWLRIVLPGQVKLAANRIVARYLAGAKRPLTKVTPSQDTKDVLALLPRPLQEKVLDNLYLLRDVNIRARSLKRNAKWPPKKRAEYLANALIEELKRA